MDLTSSIVQGNQHLEMVLVWLLVCAHDPLENLCRHLATVKFDADVWASMLSFDLHHVLSVMKQNDLPQKRPCARSLGITSKGHYGFTSRSWSIRCHG